MLLLLEIARGIAALWVFFFHVKGYFEDNSEVLYRISEFGHYGVPMFFVISGFVITYSAESSLKNSYSPFIFLKKRALRIYPVFWASIILILALPYVVELISMFKSGYYVSPKSLINKYTISEWLNFTLLTKVFFAESNNLQLQFNAINAVYWTIAIEFQFYLIVFIALFFKSYYKHIIIVISSLAIINLLSPFNVNHGLFIHYWPSFSVGILLAYLFKSKLTLPQLFPKYDTVKFSLIALPIFIVIAVISLNNQPANFFFALVFALLLWCISPLETCLANVKKKERTLGFYIIESSILLGAMSYSVYLLHGKLQMLPAMFVRQIIDESSVLFGLMTIIMTLLICYPFYLYVERPFMSKNHVNIHKKALSPT